ncbi:MAG: PH domain-containing protein [Planctomycetia bacterium]|nr:PH domain-containing protein [Planctomycetia bacterium]
MSDTRPSSASPAFDPYTIARPDPALLKYYVIVSFLAGPAFIVPLIPLLCKYYTLRYHFDDKGISMSWGVLFRREILLTYRRIQDIHLTRNILQRWMGLANVSIQTASGAASAEMAIEGILQAEELRDFLYHQMRGARGLAPLDAKGAEGTTAGTAGAPSADEDEALRLLGEIRDTLVRLAAREKGPP